MKITFIGLSCFLIENDFGGRVLLDPYKDAPEHFLGLRFPKEIQADIFLVSHPDDDHSNLTSSMLRTPSKADSSPSLVFPNINIKGSLVKEYSGDLNIAYSFTLDDLRIIHLADNAHVLTQSQLDEIGHVDILIVSPPKVKNSYAHIDNIHLLNPKIAILSHYLPVLPETPNPTFQQIKDELSTIILQTGVTNPHANETTITTLATMFIATQETRSAFELSKEIFDSSIEIRKDDLIHTGTNIVVFRDCLGRKYAD